MSNAYEWTQPFTPFRDMPFMISVPKECCHPMTDTMGKLWCEIAIPPRFISQMNELWSTIVIEPEHIYYHVDNPDYYTFWINSGADLNLYYKSLTQDGSNRVIIGYEKELADNLLLRFLQWEAYRNGCITSNVDNIMDVIKTDYLTSGLTMINFINTLHK